MSLKLRAINLFDRLLFTYLFALPFANTLLSQIIGFTIAAVTIYLVSTERKGLNKFTLLFSILLTVGMLWSIIFLDVSALGRVIDHYYPLLVFALAFQARRVDEKLGTLIWAFILGTTAAYLLTLGTACYHYFTGIMPWTGRLSDVFFHEQLGFIILEGHPTYFSLYGCTATVLIIYFFDSRKLLSFIFIGFFTIMIGLLFARMTMILQIVLLLLFIYRNIAASLKLKLILIPIMIAAIFVGYRGLTYVYDYPHRQMFQELETAWQRSAQPNLNETDWGIITRLALWRAGAEVALAHPIFGVGPAKEKQVVADRLVEKNQEFVAGLDLDPHNQYLAFLISYGSLGTLLIIGAQLLLLYKARRNTPYVVFILMMAVAGLTESLMLRYFGVSLFAVVGAMLFFNHRTEGIE